MVFDEEDSILRILSSTVEFYFHESCGQCTPCRDGTNILKKLMERILSEAGREEDYRALVSVARGIRGRTICPFGDAVSMAVEAMAIKYERDSGLPREPWLRLPSTAILTVSKGSTVLAAAQRVGVPIPTSATILS